MTVLVAALFGMALGSFINAAVDRRREGVSLWGRSSCDACNRVLDVHELVPVVSYVILRGRCATCRAPIGVRTPLVEVACGAVFAAGAAVFGLPVLVLMLGALLCAAAITVAVQVPWPRGSA